MARKTPALTPHIGIGDKDRAAIAAGLSRLLADTYTLYLTTHNFHWNVTGPMFNTLHTMFMAQYTELWNAGGPDSRRAGRAHSLAWRAPRAMWRRARMPWSSASCPPRPPRGVAGPGGGASDNRRMSDCLRGAAAPLPSFPTPTPARPR
jgi:starvation-inducible DNA-binding protein